MHRAHQARGLVRAVDVWRHDALHAQVEGPQQERGVARAAPDQDGQPERVGGGDVAAQVAEVVRAVLAVDEHEVVTGDGQHLDELLRRHPHQRADQVAAALQTLSQRGQLVGGHAIIPPEKSTSVPVRPGSARMHTSASATSSGVTIRPRAARSTNALTSLLDGRAGALGLEAEVAVHAVADDRSGGQGVDADAVPPGLVRQRGGQPDHRHLGGAVGRPPREGALARHRGDVDDVARTPAVHRRQERLAHQEGASHVDGEDLVPVRGADVLQRCDRTGDPGVVDEHRDLLVGQPPGQRSDVVGDETSHTSAEAAQPSRAATSASAAARRPTSTTRSPSSTSRCAMAAPRPLPPPVTTARRPARWFTRAPERPPRRSSRTGRPRVARRGGHPSGHALRRARPGRHARTPGPAARCSRCR